MSFVDVDTDAALGVLPGTTGQVDPTALGIAGDSGTASGTGPGRYGFRLSDLGGSMGNPFSAIWNWFNSGFTTPLSPADIFLIVGVILIAFLLWNLLLYHLRIAAEAL